MRVVLDTNVFISAVLGGKLGGIVNEWKDGKFTLIITDAIAREYLDVINRPKFKIPQNEIITVTNYLLQSAEFVTPQKELHIIVADLTDNKFLEAATAGKVNFIVCGDNHLSLFRKFQLSQRVNLSIGWKDNNLRWCPLIWTNRWDKSASWTSA